jgi:RHS repeat-associated protein
VAKGYGTPQAATTRYDYDPATLVPTSITDGNGHVTRYTVDGQGSVLTMTDPVHPPTINTYNSLNELLTTKDGNGVTTTSTYDGRGNLTQTSRPLVGASLVQTVTYHHDDPKNPGDVTSVTDPDGKVWTYEYDRAGNRVRATDPLGDSTTAEYNPDGWQTASVTPKGNVDRCHRCREQYETTYLHDLFGRVILVRDPLGHLTTTHYDANGNVDRAADGDGNTTVYIYDPANEQTAVKRADGTTITTDYNVDGTVHDQKDGKRNAVQTYGYDPLARVTSTTDALGYTTGYGLDPVGNVVTEQAPGGDCMAAAKPGCTVLTYDPANQLSRISYSDAATPNVTGISYDGDGQRMAVTDGTGTWTWQYDSLHHPTSVTEGSFGTVGYAYSLTDHVTEITYPDGHQVTNGFDDAGRETSVRDWLGNTTSFTYDRNGNLTEQRAPSSPAVVDRFSFDQADRLMGIVVVRRKMDSDKANGDEHDAKILFQANYGRDGNSQLTKDSSQPERTENYGYTKLNQLCAASSRDDTDCEQPGTESKGLTYQYDQADNLVRNGKTTQRFNAADELCWTSSQPGSNPCSSAPAGAIRYTYDQRGNLTAIKAPAAAATTLAYDQANRLTNLTHGITSATYTYNADGLRMSKTRAGGSPSSFIWDIAKGLPLMIRDDNGSYVTGPDGLPVEQITAEGAVAYYHRDQLGSTRALSDRAGEVIQTYDYDPYGNRTGGRGSSTNPFQYGGQYLDAESGLYYLRARYYDPQTAQFLSRDPLLSRTRAAYGYGNGGPLATVDATGLGDNGGGGCWDGTLGPACNPDPVTEHYCNSTGQCFAQYTWQSACGMWLQIPAEMPFSQAIQWNLIDGTWFYMSDPSSGIYTAYETLNGLVQSLPSGETNPSVPQSLGPGPEDPNHPVCSAGDWTGPCGYAPPWATQVTVYVCGQVLDFPLYCINPAGKRPPAEYRDQPDLPAEGL